MAIGEGEKEFAAHVVEMIQAMGPVYTKTMFGGFGVFLDGKMFGLIANSELYLKVDAENLSQFEALGLQPFTYHKKGKPMQMKYYQVPEDAMDNLELMAQWGNIGFAAACRAASKSAGQARRNRGPAR